MKNFKEFLNETNDEKVNESGVYKTGNAIQDDLKNFLAGTIIPKSKGYVKEERDAALLLYDILSHLYNI